MNEEQMVEMLNQIPLDVLQDYVAQRAQQEQAAMQQQAPGQVMMAHGGYIVNPYIDVFACGGRAGHMPHGKGLPSTKGRRK